MTARRALAAIAGAFRRHLLLYLATMVVLFLLSAGTTGWRWAFWPMLVWGIALLIHYLLYKSSIVDERWAEERVEELNLKSYDRSHIESIKEKGRDGDAPGARD